MANDSNTQYPRSSAAARGLYAEGPAAGPPADDDDGDDDVWTVGVFVNRIIKSVEEIHLVGTVNNVEALYFIQLKYVT